MEKFRTIKPYNNKSVSEIVQKVKSNALMQEMLQYGFPNLTEDERDKLLLNCKSVVDFQTKIMYQIVHAAMDRSIQEFTTSGFEKLKPDEAYVFISNHRDIILDTSLLNLSLHDYGLHMTASAIGDNLVKKKFLLRLAMLNRNFLIHRGLPPRETLLQSKIVSQFIRYCITENERSVWIAQREGRTKNGDDRTQQGVLKMLSLAREKGESVMQYLKKLNIVPVSISYEFDPTDMMKMPMIMAQHYGEEYQKTRKEDLENIIQGLIGQKGRVHITIGSPLSKELDDIEASYNQGNKQFQALAELLDKHIHQQYKLWPANYIAYDLLYNTDKFSQYYTDKELRQFERRLSNRGNPEEIVSREKYLGMYANPVVNQLQYAN